MSLAAAACSNDEAPVEEPVQASPQSDEAPADDDDGGALNDANGANGAAEPDAEGGDANMAAPPPAANAPEDAAPAAAPNAPQPSPEGGGGIISSGAQADPVARCRSIVNFERRKRCFQTLRKAQGN
jgi:hypothetical protein